MDAEKQAQMLTLFGEYRAEAGSLDVETKRNIDNIDLFEAILREAYPDITLVVSGHHIMFMRAGQPAPGEIASADTLIFDHDIAPKIWGPTYKDVLTLFAAVAPPHRDVLVRQFYFNRQPTDAPSGVPTDGNT